MKALALLGLLALLIAPAALAQDEADVAGTLRVSETAFATQIVDRMPDGGAESYPVGTRVYLWCRLHGGAEGDRIYHVWFHEGDEIQSVELPVNLSHWRTWSYKTLYPGQSGEWRVEIQNAQGEVLSAATFTATE